MSRITLGARGPLAATAVTGATMTPSCSEGDVEGDGSADVSIMPGGVTGIAANDLLPG